MEARCPGTDRRFLKVEIHKCSVCRYNVEIFSDEIKVICPKCKNEVYRDKTPSCIDWCKYARECLGEKKWQELKKHMDETQSKTDFKERILSEMRKYLDTDTERIQHSEQVLRYAEQILKIEKGDRNVVIPVAILHDIGWKECKKKYNSTDGQLQEKEGPPIAKKIMENLGIKQETIQKVCRIISCHHSPGEIDTLNFKILWDADCLVNQRDKYISMDKESLERIIKKIFMTETGKKLAEEIYLN